jgi:type VI protein secretion system component VasK
MALSLRALIDRFPASDVRTAESEAKDESFDALPVRGFLWTLFVFKMATVGAIIWYAGGSGEAGILLTVTTWPWLIIPGIVLFGWLAYRFRLRRVRARRLALQRAEWMLDERGTMDGQLPTGSESVTRGVDGWHGM